MPFGKFTATVPRVGPVAVSFRTVLEVIAAAVLLAGLGVRLCQLDRARTAAGKSALEADTLRASLDHSRTLAIVLDGMRHAEQRQAVQVRAERDDVDRQLGLERIAKAELEIKVERLATILGSSAAVTETADGDRSARFVVDSTPYHVAADVTLPRPPGRGRISLGVSLDPIALEARQGCSDANEAGIRSAYLTVIGPDWAPVTVGRVEQDPGLCRSPALEPVHGDGRAWWRKAIDRVGVSAGLGATFGVDVTGKPAAVFGPSILVGVKVWP